MKFYFSLQINRLHRWFRETSLSPLVGWLLTTLLFIGLSFYLFSKTTYASWIYIFIALTITAKLGEKNRNHRLKLIYNRKLRFKIRFIENVLLCLPFAVFLVYQKDYLIALYLSIGAFLMTFFTSGASFYKVIPTPFKKRPFEFIVGFRKSVLALFVIYLFFLKAIQVDNYNLALVLFGLLFFINMSFYNLPESRFFVWVYSTNSKGFLLKKIWNAMVSTLILNGPILAIISIIYPQQLLLSSGVFLLGLLFISTVILAKYAAFPNEISISQGVYFTLCFVFPPLLLVVIPMFYKQSKNNIENILE